MKTLLLLTVMSLTTATGFARRGLPVFYGATEKVQKVLDLPDIDSFKTSTGEYYDLGVTFTSNHIFWVPYSCGEAKLCGKVVGKDMIVDLTAEEIKDVERIANVKAPAAKAPFWDRIGGKLVYGGIIGLIIWGFIPSRKKRNDTTTTTPTTTEREL
jgi:hypothetical protein